MSDLKHKLAKKVNVIESNNAENSIEPTKNDSNNVIVLKGSENDTSTSVVPDFAITLSDAKNRIEMLQSFVREMMIVNVDYGFIPNCSKPSLFKSGAEKLCDIFGFSKKIQVMNRVEDWEKALFHYEVKTILINKKTGLIEAEGVGSCNNRERKYKTQDGYSIVNNILKMAKKRAFIDAVLSATRSSGLFTQDMEDNPLYPNDGNGNKSSYINTINKSDNAKYTDNSFVTDNIGTVNGSNRKKYNNSSSSDQIKQLLSKAQQCEIVSIIKQNNISINEIKNLIKKRYKVSETKYFTSIQAEDFIQYLKIYTSI